MPHYKKVGKLLPFYYALNLSQVKDFCNESLFWIASDVMAVRGCVRAFYTDDPRTSPSSIIQKVRYPAGRLANQPRHNVIILFPLGSHSESLVTWFSIALLGTVSSLLYFHAYWSKSCHDARSLRGRFLFFFFLSFYLSIKDRIFPFFLYIYILD